MILSKIKRKYTIIVVSIAIVFSSFGFVAVNEDVNFEITKNLDIYFTLFRELNMFYVDEIDPGELIKTSIDKMLISLDPYTNYIPESDIEGYKLMTTGQYGGIGALIRKSDDYVVISNPYEGKPAQVAGLRSGDVILEIDGNDVKGKTIKQVSERLKGSPNTELKLKIKRLGTEDPIDFLVIRKEIKLSNVPYSAIVNDSIGYLRLSRFTTDAANEVKKAVIKLKEQNAKGIIFDLRSNPGGLLMEAIKISNIFVDKGEDIVSTKGKVSQWDKEYKAMFTPVDTEIPIVILVNSQSASASEIVSGSLQDLDRAVIMGERSFGKGLVQTTRKLSYNAQLKVTTAKYYIPSGRCIQALDYTNRREDGSVGKIPDSLITEFITKNGRIVKDGGGISPDIYVESEYMSPISISLSIKNLIFDYATEYVFKHDSITSPKKYKFTDEDFNAFVEWLKDKDFDYETVSSSKVDELIEIAKKEKYYEQSENELIALKEKLAHDKNKDLQANKKEIIELLTEEIISRYYYQNGRMETILLTDPIIDSAVSVLNDSEKYTSILKGTCKDANHQLKVKE
jgi:carboxyl-terminal processing protease